MRRSGRVINALMWLTACAVLFGPVLEGAFDFLPAAVLAGLLFVLCVYAFSARNTSALPKRVSVVALSACFAVTAFDLSVRAYRFYIYDDRPKELYMRPWPPLPEVFRYVPNVRFEGESYGNLSGMSRRKDWREYKRTLFVTDEYGFRNEPAEGGRAPEPDLIVLGDSFGEARDTRQDETLSAILSGAYGRRVYNLSMEGASPWQEYVSLLTETDRLRPKEGAVVLWLLFEGNDLDDQYLPYFDASQLPWRGRLGQLIDSAQEFRHDSPLHNIIARRKPPGREQVIERKFIDGRRLLFMLPYARNRELTADEIRRHPNFDMLKETFGAMKRLADEKHLTVAVALIPSKEEVYSWVLDGAPPWSASAGASPFSAALEEMTRQNGMAYLDLKPHLLDASRRVYEESGGLLWWADDTHWNASGQKAAAEAIQQQLLEPLKRGGPAHLDAHAAPER